MKKGSNFFQFETEMYGNDATTGLGEGGGDLLLTDLDYFEEQIVNLRSTIEKKNANRYIHENNKINYSDVDKSIQ